MRNAHANASWLARGLVGYVHSALWAAALRRPPVGALQTVSSRMGTRSSRAPLAVFGHESQTHTAVWGCRGGHGFRCYHSYGYKAPNGTFHTDTIYCHLAQTRCIR